MGNKKQILFHSQRLWLHYKPNDLVWVFLMENDKSIFRFMWNIVQSFEFEAAMQPKKIYRDEVAKLSEIQIKNLG